MKDLFLVASIIKPVGQDGYFAIKSFSDFSDTFVSDREIFIDVWGEYRKFYIQDVIEKNDNLLLKVKNFDSGEYVRFLIGKDIFVTSSDSRKLDDEEYYIHDLIGLKVYQSEKFFGEVTDVLTLSSNDVLVVKRADGKEALIPFINDYVFDVDVQKGRITVSDKEEYLYDED